MRLKTINTREPLSEYKLLINPISSPLLLALYKDDTLLKSWQVDGYVSDSLVEELKKILDEYKISEIIYANGPGSYMGVKLTYILLKTLEIIKEIPFFGALGFELNNNLPIKAMGKLYFIKEKETIITKKFDEAIEQNFFAPKRWSEIKKSSTNEPLYNIPAV